MNISRVILAIFALLLLAVLPTYARADKVTPEELDQIKAAQEATQQKLADAMNALAQSRQAFDQAKGSIEEGTHATEQHAQELGTLEDEVRSLQDAVHLLSTQVNELLDGKTNPKLSQQQKQEMDEYLLGLDAYNADKLGSSRQILQGFLSKYPRSRWRPNALYWIGETNFREGNYQKAIETYQNVVSAYPQGEWTRRALFKQGVSFFQLKDYQSSLAFFAKVAQSYPKTSEGFRALDYQKTVTAILKQQNAAKGLSQ